VEREIASTVVTLSNGRNQGATHDPKPVRSRLGGFDLACRHQRDPRSAPVGQQRTRHGADLQRDFPEAIAELVGGEVWLREDVEAWIADHSAALADVFKVGR